MSCHCGRQGLCATCCCIHPWHNIRPQNFRTASCPLCKHTS